MTSVEYVTSADGTRIAVERPGGGGEPLIVVTGALQGRETYQPLAVELSRHLTVWNYDRRGRGDSGDTAPYTVEREVEDLGAVVAHAGGRATVYGHSSGAALVLHAAARGLAMDAIVLHDPPFGSGDEQERQAVQKEADEIATLLAQGRRSDALSWYFGSMGLPPEVVEHLSQDVAMLAHAPTLRYDPYAIMSQESRDGRTPAEQARGVAVPALVLAGGASPDFMIHAGRQIAEALPAGRFHLLVDQGHVVPPEILAPVVTSFVNRPPDRP